MKKPSLSVKLGAACLSVAAFTAYSVGVAAPADATASPYTVHRIKVDPDAVHVSNNLDAATFSCQPSPIDGSQGPKCYSPAEMQKAYGADGFIARGDDGTGRTIVIVDAYVNPYIASDLKLFDALFDLPDPVLDNYVMPGTPVFDPADANQVGWGGETTLDVEWAHAMAPGAKIELVSAASNEDADILSATQYAVDHDLGDVLSQSFGENENCVDPDLLKAEHAMFQKATRQGWTIFASSGDSGAAQFTCDGAGAVKAASSPATDPLVTGVGGTTLDAGTDGTYAGETAWDEFMFGCNPPAVSAHDVQCSGGGVSDIYKRPAWQASMVKTSGRGEPDVAYNAGINGGVLGVCSVCHGGSPAVFLFGGTSAGSPQWAALAAITDQIAGHRVGEINPSLYKLAQVKKRYGATLHDVTIGGNHIEEIGGAGYDAGKGWDPVTGLGSPNAADLLPALARLS